MPSADAIASGDPASSEGILHVLRIGPPCGRVSRPNRSEARGNDMQSKPATRATASPRRPWARRLTPSMMVLFGLFVLLLVLGLALHGLASAIAFVLLVLVLLFLIGPASSVKPRTGVWDGPYRDRVEDPHE
jgi:hypothetical protein